VRVKSSNAYAGFTPARGVVDGDTATWNLRAAVAALVAVPSLAVADHEYHPVGNGAAPRSTLAVVPLATTALVTAAAVAPAWSRTVKVTVPASPSGSV
jgi:hypothetical protein